MTVPPGRLFGGFVAALVSIPCAAALQLITRELWQGTAPGGPLASDSGAPSGPGSAGPALDRNA